MCAWHNAQYENLARNKSKNAPHALRENLMLHLNTKPKAAFEHFPQHYPEAVAAWQQLRRVRCCLRVALAAVHAWRLSPCR